MPSTWPIYYATTLRTNQKARLINASVSATAFSLPEDHLYHDDSELPRSCKSVT
jgi:hypothetical protein